MSNPLVENECADLYTLTLEAEHIMVTSTEKCTVMVDCTFTYRQLLTASVKMVLGASNARESNEK